MKVCKSKIARFVVANEVMLEKTASHESDNIALLKELSVSQVHVIRLIHFHKPCTMGKLAKSIGITLGSVTQLIDRLVTKKYVKRIRSVEDRRIVYSELTAKGNKIIDASKKHVEKMAENILVKLTEHEQEVFVTLFEKMISD